MPEKPINIHILIPVWGENYLDAFLETGLASLLFPENIPFLAKNGCDVTAVFLTIAESVGHIKSNGIFSALSRYCTVDYITMDDLLAGSSYYGISLTLAFTRGMASVGQSMTDTYFIFYNADFILANGSLKTILGQIQAGARIILATSFRANAQNIEPELREMLINGPIEPRALAALALKHRHHTVISRTINQDAYTNPHFNQVYWQVDEQTLLARYFLTTLFCFRPSICANSASSFIDYNMAETFCPDGKIAFIEDSDAFFMLEVQDFRQELYFLKMGRTNSKTAAASISSWTTAWHRRQAVYETVIHGGNLPANFELEKGKFATFMKEVTKKLTQETIDARQHHHWVGSLAQWLPRKMRHDRKQPANQPFSGISLPLTRIDQSMIKKISDWPAWLVTLFLGTPPRAMPWHPLWRNYRELDKKLGAAIAPQQEYLFITDSFAYDGIIMKHGNPVKVFAGDALNNHLDKICGDKKYSACIIAMETDNLDIKRLLSNISAYLGAQRTIFIFFGRTLVRFTRDSKHFMDVYYHALQDMAPYSPRLAYIGNLTGLTLTKLMLDAIHRIKVNPAWSVPQMFWVACACLVNNLRCMLTSKKSGYYGATGIIAEFSLNRKALPPENDASKQDALKPCD